MRMFEDYHTSTDELTNSPSKIKKGERAVIAGLNFL